MKDKELKAEFDKIHQEFGKVRKEMKQGFDGVHQEIELVLTTINSFSTNVDGRIDKLEGNMVTKDYLDDKLANFADKHGLKVREEVLEYKPRTKRKAKA
jgi:hypothetical protein